MVKHNNQIPNIHLRKHWQRRVHTHFDQAQKKKTRLHKRQAKAQAQFPTPLQKLRPVVSSATRKYSGKTRYGRGFTLAELGGAKMTKAWAQSVGISVDHRRTNTSVEQMQANVERLNSYKGKLILFPRKEGQPKKGFVNDATADQLKKAEAATQANGNLPIAAAAKEPEFRAISADM